MCISDVFSSTDWPGLPSDTLSSSLPSRRPSNWARFRTSQSSEFEPISTNPLSKRDTFVPSYISFPCAASFPRIHIKCPSDESQATRIADVVEEPKSLAAQEMTTLGTSPTEPRRGVASPRPKGRENSKSTICRNIGIYGHCRWEKEGCAFNHDMNNQRDNASYGSDTRLVLFKLWSRSVSLLNLLAASISTSNRLLSHLYSPCPTGKGTPGIPPSPPNLWAPHLSPPKQMLQVRLPVYNSPVP